MSTGSVKDAVTSCHLFTSRSEENVATLREMLTRSPGKSTRQAPLESGLSRYTILKVLKEELDLRPWKLHHMQELTPEDCDRRMEYGELMLGWHEDFPQLFENILWSDEAIFHVGGFVSLHNCHYWVAQVPNMTVRRCRIVQMLPCDAE
jgi:hypothetical protein